METQFHVLGVAGLERFVETFPDEGDVYFYEVLKVYQEVGYQYMIMPDHVPKISGPEPDLVAFALGQGRPASGRRPPEKAAAAGGHVRCTPGPLYCRYT